MIAVALMRADDHDPAEADLLADATSDDDGARARAFHRVYDRLREVARGYLGRERAGHALEPTELVNEAMLRLAPGLALDDVTRTRLLGFASRAMRQVLVDHARRADVRRRAGEVHKITLSRVAGDDVTKSVSIQSLVAGLEWLESEDRRLAEMIEWHYFGGMTGQQMADQLGISRASVNRELALARALLLSEIDRRDTEST